MKAPSGLNIKDQVVGSGRVCVPGDLAICKCTCRGRKGDLVYASKEEEPFSICIGARDSVVAIEYGLLGMKVGGLRTVVVPPHLTYVERKTFKELPEQAMLVYELELIDLPEKWDPEMEQRLKRRSGPARDS